MSKRWPGVMLIVSYVLLVAVVVVGAYFIRNEFIKAQQERCDILQIQIDVMAVQALIIDEQGRNQDPPPQANELLEQARANMNMVCPDPAAG